MCVCVCFEGERRRKGDDPLIRVPLIGGLFFLSLSLEGELASLDAGDTLLSPEGLGAGLLGGEGTALSTGGSGTEVEGLVLLSLEELADLVSLLLGDGSLHAGNTVTELPAVMRNVEKKKREKNEVEEEERRVLW